MGKLLGEILSPLPLASSGLTIDENTHPYMRDSLITQEGTYQQEISIIVSNVIKLSIDKNEDEALRLRDTKIAYSRVLNRKYAKAKR
ncbi:MAG: hypothetical protein U5N85_01855 [Arcicella sp.]|nr:hypothetical protein [Arcicella sp.]